MRKNIFYLTILTGILFFSLTVSAQEARQTPVSPAPPKVIANKLPSDNANIPEPVVSPAVPQKSLPSTADAKPSQAPLKINKVNEPQQANANQATSQPAATMVPLRTDNLVVPTHAKTEIPDPKHQPPSPRIKE